MRTAAVVAHLVFAVVLKRAFLFAVDELNPAFQPIHAVVPTSFINAFLLFISFHRNRLLFLISRECERRSRRSHSCICPHTEM